MSGTNEVGAISAEFPIMVRTTFGGNDGVFQLCYAIASLLSKLWVCDVTMHLLPFLWVGLGCRS